MRTVIYARLSKRTDKNALNLEDQMKRCREWCTKRGWDVVAECSDYGESAFDRDSMEDRPGFGQLLTLVRERQVDAVLAWRPDRLFRDPIEQALFFRECVRAGVATVATVAEGERDPANPGDEMVGTIVAAVSRYESNAKRQRILAKHRQLAEQGKVAGGGDRPFGYEHDRKTIVESEAAEIRWAAEQVLSGASLRSVVMELRARNVATTSGKPWSTVALKRILTRGRWAGLREHRGMIVSEAEWPGILTVDQFANLRALLTDPARTTATYSRSYLLTGGLAICGVCGAKLVSRPRGDHERCYVCASGPGFYGCGKIRRLADAVENEVVERFWAALDDGLIADAEPEPSPDMTGVSLVELERAMTDLARDHYVLKLITRAEFLAAREPLAAQVETLKAELNAPTLERRSLAGIRDGWELMSIDDRKAALREVIDEVVVHPCVRGRNTFDPSKIEVRWKV